MMVKSCVYVRLVCGMYRTAGVRQMGYVMLLISFDPRVMNAWEYVGPDSEFCYVMSLLESICLDAPRFISRIGFPYAGLGNSSSRLVAKEFWVTLIYFFK